MLPSDFEQIARAYSKSLKERGFVFVRLEEEEFNLLVDEIFLIIAKVQACLKKLSQFLNSQILQQSLEESENKLEKTFGKVKKHKFECKEEPNMAFLTLISLENLLLLKLMMLSVKSEQLEVCGNIAINIASIFANSFDCDGFKLI